MFWETFQIRPSLNVDSVIVGMRWFVLRSKNLNRNTIEEEGRFYDARRLDSNRRRLLWEQAAFLSARPALASTGAAYLVS